MPKRGNKALKKRTVSMIAAATAFVLSVLVYGQLAFGWFSVSEKIGGDGMGVSLSEGSGTFGTVTYFPVTGINGNDYTIPKVVPDGYRPELPTYDPAKLLTSKYKDAIVLVLHYTVPDDTYRLTVHCDDAWYDNSVAGDETNKEFQNILSNVTQLSLCTVATETDDSVTLTSAAELKSFVTTSPTLGKGTTSLSFDLSKPEDGNSGNLYILVEYYPEMIEYYSVGAGYLKMYFNNDLTFSLEKKS